MKKLKLLVLLLPFIIISCSDDDGPTKPGDETPVDFFPTTSGSTWVFNTLEINAEGNTDPSTQKTDSVMIDGSTSKTAKTASVFKTYRENAGNWDLIDTDYYVNENGTVLVHSDFISSRLTIEGLPAQLPIQIGDRWLKLADKNQTSWDVYSESLNGRTVKFPFAGTDIDATFENTTFTIRGRNNGQKQITLEVNGTNYTATEFVLELKLVGTLVSLFSNSAVNLNTTYTVYMVKDLGIVKSRFAQMRVQIAGLLDESIPGVQKEMIRSTVQVSN